MLRISWTRHLISEEVLRFRTTNKLEKAEEKRKTNIEKKPSSGNTVYEVGVWKAETNGDTEHNICKMITQQLKKVPVNGRQLTRHLVETGIIKQSPLPN